MSIGLVMNRGVWLTFIYYFFCTLVRLRGIVTERLPIQNMSQLCSPSLGAILLSMQHKGLFSLCESLASESTHQWLGYTICIKEI